VLYTYTNLYLCDVYLDAGSPLLGCVSSLIVVVTEVSVTVVVSGRAAVYKRPKYLLTNRMLLYNGSK